MKHGWHKFFSNWKKIEISDEKMTLKECYKGLILFSIMNFIMLMIWGYNPWKWTGLMGYIFDLFVILYIVVSLVYVTITLFKRFNDAKINRFNAWIYPLTWIILSVFIRLRIWTSGVILALCIVFFLSHFYLMMLVMMPTHSENQSQDSHEK